MKREIEIPDGDTLRRWNHEWMRLTAEAIFESYIEVLEEFVKGDQDTFSDFATAKACDTALTVFKISGKMGSAIKEETEAGNTPVTQEVAD